MCGGQKKSTKKKNYPLFITVHEYEDSRYLSGRGKIHFGLTRIFTSDINCIVSILRRCACLKPCFYYEHKNSRNSERKTGKIHFGLTRFCTSDSNFIVSILRKCVCLKPWFCETLKHSMAISFHSALSQLVSIRPHADEAVRIICFLF